MLGGSSGEIHLPVDVSRERVPGRVVTLPLGRSSVGIKRIKSLTSNFPVVILERIDPSTQSKWVWINMGFRYQKNFRNHEIYPR